jgi:capsular polysaccharide biosynthesis protein
VLVSLIGAILAACFTNFFIEPQYTATVKLYAYNSSDNRLGSDNSITSGDYDASASLVGTYLEVVKSNTFLEKVAEKFDNKISATQIKSMISCAQIDETLAFQISVKSTNAEMAAEIANAIADTCPDEIVRIIKVGGVSIIDRATVPTSPTSPNVKKNVLIGFVAAFALSFAFFFIRELFDTSIKDEKDLEREFDIPILGSIPRLIPINERDKTENSTTEASVDKPGINLTISEKEDK